MSARFASEMPISTPGTSPPQELGFARESADRFLFFDEGLVVVEGTPEHFFTDPKEERTKLFLRRRREEERSVRNTTTCMRWSSRVPLPNPLAPPATNICRGSVASDLSLSQFSVGAAVSAGCRAAAHRYRRSHTLITRTASEVWL